MSETSRAGIVIGFNTGALPGWFMVTIDAQIIGRSESWGKYLTWQGGRYALAHGEELGRRLKEGDIVQIYNLSLRVIAPEFYAGAGSDRWIVARANDPSGELKVLARSITMPLVRFVYRCEAAVMAFRLKYHEGMNARFTAWVAAKVL